MKKIGLEFEFDKDWFLFSLNNYFFPLAKIHKKLFYKGNLEDKKYYYKQRFFQLCAIILFPITIFASLHDSIKFRLWRVK